MHGRGSCPELLQPFIPRKVVAAEHVLPRGPYDFEDGAAWYLGRPAPLEELQHSVEKMQALLQVFWSLGHTPERTVLWGFSQGAMLALQLTALSEKPFAGTIAVGGKLHASLAEHPSRLERVRGRRFLLIHGRADAIIPPEDGETARDLLRSAGAEVAWQEHPLGHLLNVTVTSWMEPFSSSVLGR